MQASLCKPATPAGTQAAAHHLRQLPPLLLKPGLLLLGLGHELPHLGYGFLLGFKDLRARGMRTTLPSAVSTRSMTTTRPTGDAHAPHTPVHMHLCGSIPVRAHPVTNRARMHVCGCECVRVFVCACAHLCACMRVCAPMRAPPLLPACGVSHAHLVGVLDCVRHVLFDLGQLPLEVAVYALEHDALAPQVIDLLPQLLVVCDTLVVFDVRALQAVLQELDALLQGRGTSALEAVGLPGLTVT